LALEQLGCGVDAFGGAVVVRQRDGGIGGVQVRQVFLTGGADPFGEPLGVAAKPRRTG
jgi:hypothetical protein